MYWLVYGLYYRVTANVFSVPKSTVCLNVYKITAQINRIVREGKVISYPKRYQLDDIGQGFARLANHDAFSKATGAIDGCHICIKSPSTHKEDYYNYKHFF